MENSVFSSKKLILFLGLVMWIILLFFILCPTFAIDNPNETLHNPQQEARAQAIGSQLRCLVCQNENIEESDSALAKDLRQIIRQQIVKGKSNQQIIDWMVIRYGDFIRLCPPFNAITAILWSMPLIALSVGGWLMWRLMRRLPVSFTPLNEAEKKRITELIADK